MINRYLLIFFIGVTFSARAQNEHVLTLRQCIEYAWLNNPDVRQSILNNETAKLDKLQSRTNLLPFVSMNAGQNYQFGRTIDRFTNQFAEQTIRSNNFSLNASLVLFDGLQNINSIKLQSFLERASANNIESAQNQIALSVANAFLQIIQADEIIRSVRFQIESTEQRVSRAGKMYDVGTTDLANLLGLKAQLANEQLNLVNAENSKNAAVLNLKTIMQFPANKELQFVKPLISDELIINPFSLDELYSIAVENMPEVKAARQQAEAAFVQTRIAKGSMAPVISLYGSLSTVYSQTAKTIDGFTPVGMQIIGYTQSTNEPVLQPIYAYQLRTIDFNKQLKDNLGQSAGITLSWNIFTGFQTRNQIQKSFINKKISELNLQKVQNTLLNEINTALNSYNAAKSKFDASQNNTEAQKLNFDFLQKRFDAGMVNLFEYIQTKNNFLQAQSTEIQAKYELIFRGLILDFYKGKPINL